MKAKNILFYVAIYELVVGLAEVVSVNAWLASSPSLAGYVAKVAEFPSLGSIPNNNYSMYVDLAAGAILLYL